MEVNEAMARIFDPASGVDFVITATNPDIAFGSHGPLPSVFGGIAFIWRRRNPRLSGPSRIRQIARWAIAIYDLQLTEGKLAAEKEAAANQWPMAIAIVDSTAHLVLFQRADQTQLGSMEVSVGKAMTAVRFRRSTKVFEEAIAAGGAGVRITTMPGVLALEGGVPIIVDGQVIGAIGVSGMLSTQDAQVAAAGLAALSA